MTARLSVVVASHRRPLRLRWLLNALAEQTLADEYVEVIVGHDSGAETSELLRTHPLVARGVLRHVQSPDGPPGANRNAALALARAPVVVFTDDDCRPPPGWLSAVLDATRRNPGAVIQGPVRSDPGEQAMLRSSHPRLQDFTDVPRPWAECANIAYPRAVLEPFREDVRTGEDTDLCLRVRARGVPFVGDAAMVTFHAVVEGSLLDALRDVPRWGDLASLVGRHPELRSQLFAGVFWKPSHFWLIALLATPVLPDRGWRQTAQLTALAGWGTSRHWRGGGWRGKLRHARQLPGYAVLDLFEISVLARASVREHALLL